MVRYAFQAAALRRRCRKHYAERQSCFLKQVSRFGLPMTFPITGRGMNLAGMFPSNLNDRACNDRLRLGGLDVPPVSWYAVGLTPPGLPFGLAAFDKQAIQRGVARMAVAFDGKGARLSN
jgi:GntR family transcriptional regulator / MocR family aminotransferase